MCGIVGVLDSKGVKESILIKMRDSMIHRGPDDAGFWISDDRRVGFAHRRLSILDLSPQGHQPMEFDNLVIVYNGEIYNFQEIKGELEKKGYAFKSNTDTEVILKAFHCWGFECVHKFRGMWAFAIWDKEKKQLILCRDRIGVKPLYWYYKNGLFMFASELKAFYQHPGFTKELSMEGLSLYLQYGYITAPYSIFKHTHKLSPGHFLKVDSKGKVRIERYWDISYQFLKGVKEKNKWLVRNEEEVLEELEKILTDSFKLRLVSDVPVGIFLSGGIDSTLVTTLLQREITEPLKTFTIGFHEEEYNEALYAKKIAEYLGTEHTELYCTYKEAIEIIPKLPEIYDEPFADSSAIPTYLVSKLAKDKVKVSLSADGGDEQFFGYPRYFHTYSRLIIFKDNYILKLLAKALGLLSFDTLEDVYFALFGRHLKNKLLKMRILSKENLSDIGVYDLGVKYFFEEDIKRMCPQISNLLNHLKKFSDNLLLSRYIVPMYYDFHTYLPDDILTKVDRATMQVSIEGREPLLDVRIVEFSSQLPLELKYKNGISKYLLKKILGKYLPLYLFMRPKHGFGVPIYSWMKKELKNFCLDFLNSDRIRKEGIFAPEFVEKLVKKQDCQKLWIILVFELWRQKWLD